MIRWFRYVSLTSLAVAPLVLVAAFVLERAFATEVQIVASRSAEEIRINRGLWQEGDSVAEIYGVPVSGTTAVLFVDDAAVLRPAEDPSLALLPVDKQAGQNPLQVRTLWFLAWRVALGLVLAGAIGLGVVAWSGRTNRRRVFVG